MKPREGRQQAGMNVQDALRPGRDELGAEQAHVACKADPLDPGRAQSRRDRGLVGAARCKSTMRQGQSRDRPLACANQAGRIRDVAHDEHDLGRRRAALKRLRQRDEVAPATG